MTTEEQQTVVTNIQNLQTQITSLETLVQPLYQQPLSQLTTQLTPLDAARLHSAVAYALATLEVCYLKLHNINHKTHQVTGDLIGIRTSMNKIQEASKMLETIAADKEKKDKEADKTTDPSIIKDLPNEQNQDTQMKDGAMKSKLAVNLTAATSTLNAIVPQNAKVRKRK